MGAGEREVVREDRAWHHRSMRVRYAAAADLEFVISGLEDARALEGRPPDEVAARPEVVEAFRAEIASQRVRVAEEGGEPVAFLAFRLDKPVMYVKPPFLWVDLVYVRGDQRGKGLGRLLYEDAAAIAAERGCDRVVCDVFAANEGSLAFHESMGYAPLYTIFVKPV